MIAVMGASGNVGSKVAALLIDSGQDVRVLQHQAPLDELGARGATVVLGDALDTGDLQRFFDEADAALVLLPEKLSDPDFVANRSRIARNIAQALQQSPVGHVVAISALPAGRAGVRGPAAGLRELENLLAGIDGTNVLVLRPTSYMDYLLFSLPLIESRRINGGVVGAGVAYPMIATADVAREATGRLTSRDFSGFAVKPLLGPEEVSMGEATAMIGSLLGMPDLPYVQFPPEQAKAALQEAGASEEAARLLVEMQLDVDSGAMFGWVERGPNPSPGTTLKEFLESALSR